MLLGATATITYEERSITSSGDDPITGEPVYALTGAKYTLRVSLEQIASQGKTTPIPGTDRTGVYCEGRAKTDDDCPLMEIPDWYHADTTYNLTWDDGKKGTFYAMPTILGRLRTERCFGYPIKGVVVSNEAK